jgi:hypothetical protein
MITTEIMGGLGNQLFQIFNLLSYSLTYKIPFYFENKPTTRKDRPHYWNNFLMSLKPFLRIAFNKNNILIYEEPNFHYEKIEMCEEMNQPFKFFGYFQSYKYFQEKEEDIFKFIKLTDSQNKLKDVYDYDNIVSLHFRIGDYAMLQQHHPLIPNQYYERALRELIHYTNRDNWKILFFCEEADIRIVNQHICILQSYYPNIIFEKIDSKYQDWEQVLIMSLCQHNIIANSSFSWWGAYFNRNHEKQVYYPSIWFGPAQGNKNTDDLFPEKWEKIYC